MLWVANAGRPELGLPAPPGPTLVTGMLAGVLAIPLYAVGYAGAARLLGPAHPRAARAVARLGAAGAAIGGAVHGITGVWIHADRISGAAPGDPAEAVLRAGAFLVPLWALVGAALAAGSALFARAVARGDTALPRGLALATPLVLTVICAGAGATSDLGRAFLVPAGPNLAHVVFFGLIAASARRERANA